MGAQTKKIVVIGGGTGTYTVLSGLKKYAVDPVRNSPSQPFGRASAGEISNGVELSAIVTMADDGGSTGILRHELGVLPPGDVRQCLVALSEAPEMLRDLFLYRFPDGTLAGHNFGNLFLSAMEKVTGHFEDAVLTAGKILNIKGRVIPVSIEPMVLMAEYENGQVLTGEYNIGTARMGKIKKMVLEREVRATASAINAILGADLVIFSPGDLYTSLIPNFLVSGITEALRRTPAKVAYVVNLMTKRGETDGFGAYDFISELEKYLGPNVIDCIFINTGIPTREMLELYKEEDEHMVSHDVEKFSGKNYRVISGDFISQIVFEKNAIDKLKRSLLRHDSEKLAKTFLGLL
jgi:uncharacterized cofD-like protein